MSVDGISETHTLSHLWHTLLSTQLRYLGRERCVQSVVGVDRIIVDMKVNRCSKVLETNSIRPAVYSWKMEKGVFDLLDAGTELESGSE